MTVRPSPLRVLLVEDSPDDAELVVRALRAAGLDIDAQRVATEPELHAALLAFMPDVVLTDWALPGFSGEATVATVHTWDRSVPCILVSGAAGEELVVRAMRSGATDYVLKGSLEALAPAVERALAERAARREQIRLEADLTAAHATVRDSETLLRGSLDAMIDPLLIASSIRDRDGTITGFQVRFANRAAAAFIGRTADSLAGAPIVGGLPFLGDTPSFEVSRTVVDSGEAWMADGVGFTVLHADGSRRRGLANVSVTRSGDGFLATWRDVTEVDRERRERERLGAALEQTSDGVLMVGLDGVVTYANPAFLAGTGLTLDAVVGGDAGMLATEALGSDGLADIMEAARARVPWHRRVVVTVPGAAIRQVDVDARPIRDDAGEVSSYIATTHDVTDLVEAEAQLERRRALGSAVAGVARQLALVDNPADIARLASHAIVATGSFAMAWVGLVDPETSRIVPIGSHGDTGYLDAIDARADTSPRGGGAAGQAVRTRRTVVVNDIAASPLMAPWQAAAERHGYHSVAALPLRYLDTTRGAIVVYGAQTDAFGPEVIEALEVLVSDVARALARLEQAARQNKLQDALAASERRFRETLANVSLVAMMLDTRGTILFANRYLLALSGWSEAEIVGLDWHDVFVPPEDRITACAGYSRVIDTGKLDHGFRGRLLTREGQIREMEWSSALLRDEAGSIVGLAGLGSDITERAEAQAALEASGVRLQAALDQMLEGVTLASAVRNEEGRIVDFRLEYVNSALARLGRVAAADQVGHTLLELFPAHKSSGLFDEYVQVVETGVPSEVEEFHYVDPDAAGGPLDQWVDVRAAKLGDGYVRSVRDVSAHHRVDVEMRRLHAAVEQSADSVMITDAAGLIEYVNPAFERVSGYALDEAVGRNPRILNSGVQGRAFYAAMWAALTAGRSFTGDMVNRRKDGSLYREEVVISPVSDETDAVTGYVAVKRDVTLEREREAELVSVARERAMIAASLADLVDQPTAALTAEAICRQVVSLSGTESASIAAFTVDGPALSLAFVRADGAPVRLRHLPLRRSRTLRSRAIGGPWVEAYAGRPSHPYARQHDELGTTALAYAPIRHAGRVVGLLTVTSAHKDATARLTENLPALLEFAGIAGAIVGPAITDLAETDRARGFISDLIRDAAFRPVFQPIVDLATGAHTGYEALTRFANGTAPDVVFAEARRVGMETELELATLTASIAAGAHLPRGAWLSLNVSPGLVVGANGQLAEILGRADRPLVLEVTEHVPVADYVTFRAYVDGLRPRVRVAVDDAGSGIANFAHIVELRPDFVKLDIAIVRRIDTDHTRQALVLGLLQFASESASQTIAEGVETELELETLRRLGVPLGQGYLLARPAPASHWAEAAGKQMTTKRTPHAGRTVPAESPARSASRRTGTGINRARHAGAPQPRAKDR